MSKYAAWWILFCAGSVHAQWRDDGVHRDATEGAMRAGALAPYTAHASLEGYRGLLTVDTGYDGVRASSLQNVRGEVVLLPARLAVFGGGQYGTPDVSEAPKLSAFGGLRVQALAQRERGVDLAFGVSYRSLAFSQLPAVVSDVALAHRFGALSLGAAAAYGQSTRENDRFGSFALHARAVVWRSFFLAADGRYSMDLELDADEPAFEPQYELLSSGLLGYVAPWIAVQLRAGVRMLQYRLQTARQLGPEVGVTVATAL